MSLFIDLNFNKSKEISDEIKISRQHRTASGRECYSLEFQAGNIRIEDVVYHKIEEGPVVLASKALKKIGKHLNTLYSVPDEMIRTDEHGRIYILMDDIPEYFQEEFGKWISYQTCPYISEHGHAKCCYVGDYRRWIENKRYGAPLKFD